MEFEKLGAAVGFGLAVALHCEKGELAPGFWDELKSDELVDIVRAAKPGSGAYEEAFSRLASKKLNLEKWCEIYEGARRDFSRDDRLAALAVRKIFKRLATRDLSELCYMFLNNKDEPALLAALRRVIEVAKNVEDWLFVSRLAPDNSAEQKMAFEKMAGYQKSLREWCELYFEYKQYAGWKGRDKFLALCTEKVKQKKMSVDDERWLGEKSREWQWEEIEDWLFTKRNAEVATFQQCFVQLKQFKGPGVLRQRMLAQAMTLTQGFDDWVALLPFAWKDDAKRAAVIQKLIELQPSFDFWKAFRRDFWMHEEQSAARMEMMRHLAKDFDEWYEIAYRSHKERDVIKAAAAVQNCEQGYRMRCLIDRESEAWQPVFEKMIATAKTFADWTHVHIMSKSGNAVRHDAELKMMELGATIKDWRYLWQYAESAEIKESAWNKMVELA